MLLVILTYVFLGKWVYRDASNRGLNPVLWTVIVLLVPSLIGLLIYFLVGRKQEMINCNKCDNKIPIYSKFCLYCGDMITNVKIVDKKSTKGPFMGFIVCIVIFFIIVMLMAVKIFIDDDFASQSEFSLMMKQFNTENTWNVSYYKSTEEFIRTIKIKDNKPSTMHVKAETKQGSLYLVLIQNDKEEKIDITNTEGFKEIDLKAFDDGKIEAVLFGKGSESVKFEAHWE